MVDYLKKVVDVSFDEAVKKVKEAAESEGFGVMLVKSISDIFKKKLGIDYPKYTIILACKPQYAKGALDASIHMGLLFPCSFVVYEEDGNVIVSHISIMKIGPEIGLAPADKMAPVIKMTGEGVHKVWDKI